MTDIDIIKTKYALYEPDTMPDDKFDTSKVLEFFMDDMNCTMKSSTKAVHENFRDEQISKVKNFFYDLFGYEQEDLEFFSEDTGIILRQSCLAERYKGYFSRMASIVSGDNFKEIYKLSMFTYDNYTENYRYLESLRDGIAFATQGVRYFGTEENTQGEFSEFFEGVFEGLIEKAKTYKK